MTSTLPLRVLPPKGDKNNVLLRHLRCHLPQGRTKDNPPRQVKPATPSRVEFKEPSLLKGVKIIMSVFGIIIRSMHIFSGCL
jgi:hypothetical protein